MGGNIKDLDQFYAEGWVSFRPRPRPVLLQLKIYSQHIHGINNHGSKTWEAGLSHSLTKVMGVSSESVQLPIAQANLGALVMVVCLCRWMQTERGWLILIEIDCKIGDTAGW